MKLQLNQDQLPRRPSNYAAVRKRYVFPYFFMICLGKLLYCIRWAPHIVFI